MIDKILVAVDRSQNDRFVFNSALSLAKAYDATLMLLHVMSITEADYPILPTYSYYLIPNDREYDIYREKIEEYKQRGLNFLQNLIQEATAAGVKAQYTQLFGNPGRMICQLANSWSADSIVVGSRRLTGLKEIFLGSVSNYVTHHAPCSVLIVRTPIDTESVQKPSKSQKVEVQ